MLPKASQSHFYSFFLLNHFSAQPEITDKMSIADNHDKNTVIK